MKGLVLLAGTVLIGLACGSQREFASNGERIYFTGRNEDGQRIEYRGGPARGMMGGRLVCASCHAADAKGDTRRVQMAQLSAPDIRWSVLAAEEGGEAGGHDAYTLETFGHAVVEGRHPGGAELGTDMPRWSLSDRDLADLAAFLQALPSD